jgi:hypothetical protein
MGAEGGARDRGIPQPEPQKANGRTKLRRESEINALRNIPTQDAGWVNPLQMYMYFFSYILYYFCTGKPQFSY